MKTDIEKLKRIIGMSMSDKIGMLNKQIDHYPDQPHLSVSDIGDHMGKEAIVNAAVYKIMTPHLIPHGTQK